jgi:hypothetical protein
VAGEDRLRQVGQGCDERHSQAGGSAIELLRPPLLRVEHQILRQRTVTFTKGQTEWKTSVKRGFCVSNLS